MFRTPIAATAALLLTIPALAELRQVTRLDVEYARRGDLPLLLDYRLAPHHRHPAAVEDVQDAVRRVRRHAKMLRIDPDRIALIGESAGGHLVAQGAPRSPPPPPSAKPRAPA